VTGIPKKRRRGQIDIRSPGEDRSRDWSDVATNQGMPSIANNYQKLGRSKEGFFPRAFRGM